MSEPAYRALAEQYVTQIKSGELPAGEQLPTIGQLQARGHSLGVSRDALKWLVEQGWAESRPGAGYFVRPVAPPSVPYSDWAQWRERSDAEIADLRRRVEELERRQP